MPGAVIYYEPQIKEQTVGKVKDVFAAALQILEQELDASPPEKVAIFLSGHDQFARLASAHGFPDKAYLLGFYASSPQEVEGASAGVYLNADGEGLFHTLGHELTHSAVSGLPSWFEEGLADYIGNLVEKATNPRVQLSRMQVFRRLVRDTVNEGTLLDQEALETFDLRAEHTCLDLDTFYGQVWQFVEYVVRWYGQGALQDLVASYRDDTQTGDPFDTVVGIPIETVWQGFSTDIVENLTEEERVYQGFEELQRLASQAEAITREFDQFIASSSGDQSEAFMVAMDSFAQRWGLLALETVRLAAPGLAASNRDLWYLYFQSKLLALQDLAQGSHASAIRSGAIANQAYALASAALKDYLLRRPSLSCE